MVDTLNSGTNGDSYPHHPVFTNELSEQNTFEWRMVLAIHLAAHASSETG